MPLIVPANEQGAGFMAAGYARASGRVGVCLVTSGPGRDQHRHAGARLHGRFDSDRRDLRPGADRAPSAPTRSRKRRWPRIMGSVAKHVFLVTDPTKLEATVRTAFEIARTGRPGPVVDRHPEGRAELGRHVPGRRHAADPGLPPAHARAGRDRARRRARRRALLRDAGRIAASADLRRRRRHQRQGAPRRCASSRSASASRWSPR